MSMSFDLCSKLSRICQNPTPSSEPKMMESPHLPSWPAKDLTPNISKEAEEQISKEIEAAMMLALEYLAAKPVNDMKKKHSFALKPCCDNSGCNLSFYALNNMKQIFKDACCPCLTCCENAAPKDKTWVSEKFFQRWRITRELFHRNLVGLGCVAPALIVAAAIATLTTTPLNALIAGTASSCGILWFAGGQTYCCSGDIGVFQVMDRLFLEGGLRVAANLELKNNYSDLAKFLMAQWESAIDTKDQEKQSKLKKLCEDISANWDNIELGMISYGINSETIHDVMSPLVRALLVINRSPLVVKSDSPVPLTGMQR